MKALPVLIFSIVAPFLLCQANGEESLLELMKQKINQTHAQPVNKALIKNIMGITDLVSDSYDNGNPDIIAKKYPFIPAKVIDIFRGLKFSNNVTSSSFNLHIQKDASRGITCIGVAKKNGKKVSFVYIQSDMHGDLEKKERCVQKTKKKKCLWFIPCGTKKWTECYPVGYTNGEIIEITKMLENKCLEGMKKKLFDANSDAEFILSNSFALTSFDGKSVCKVMPNGQLFLGKKENSMSINEAKKKGKLIGDAQKSDNGPFTLELSIKRAILKSYYPEITNYDENGNPILIQENFIQKNNQQRLFLEDEEDEIDNSSNALIKVETTYINLIDRNRRIYFSIIAATGKRPYRLLIMDTSTLVLADYDWTPLYDSDRIYFNKVDAIVPQGYKVFSENNKYFAYLSETGHLGVYQVSGSSATNVWEAEKFDNVSGPFCLVVQRNGNLKIINTKNEISWQSNKVIATTSKKKLVVTNNGKLNVIDSSSGRSIFSS